MSSGSSVITEFIDDNLRLTDNLLKKESYCGEHHDCRLGMGSDETLQSRAAKRAAHEIDNLVKKACEQRDNAERYVREVIHEVWEVCHFNSLPKWLQDNDYLHTGHRPPLKSFKACFWSIFRVHTETGNIWTHMIGCLIFLVLGSYFLFLSSHALTHLDRFVLGIFFLGAVLCLGLSSCYHTLSCHSPHIGKLFSKYEFSLLLVQSTLIIFFDP